MKLGTVLKSKLFVGIASTVTVAAVAITAAVIINQPEAYRIIKVLELSGSASVERDEAGTIEPFEGMNLQSGDTVSVYDDSEMYLNMDEDKYLTVEENTVINLIADGTAENSRTEIELKEGAILNNITQPLSSESSYTVNTPKAVMAVRGTKFRVEVTVDEDGNYITTVTVENGKVEIRLIDEDGNLTDEYIMAIAGDTVVIKTTPNSDKDPALDGTSFFVVYDAESGKYMPLYSVDSEKHEETEVTTEEVTTTETTTAEETTVTEITSAPVTTTITAASYTAPVTVPVQQTTAVQTTISSEAVTTKASSETTTKAVTTSITTTTATETTTAVKTETSTTTTTTTRAPFYPPVITGPTITSAVTTAPETTTSVTTVSSTAATTTIVTTVPETTTVTTVPSVTTSEITTVPETTTTTVTTTAPEKSAVTTVPPVTTSEITTVPETTTTTVTTTTPETTTTTTTTTEAPATTYSVVFEVDGSVYGEFEYEEGDVITSVPDIPEKEGYTGKWVTSDGNELTVGTIIEGDMTITAEYTINSYIVTFLNENGTTYTTRTVDYGNSVSVIPPVPENEGYTGKWINADGDEFTIGMLIKSDTTITAEYTINSYIVTFLNENGTTYTTRTVDYGNS
ncbi:MAG: hypothetical protein IJ416_10845, partial [Ruminiclostridium sp.]|nr:hypothetical protein [Ruminiclostridium sp.]